MTSDPGEHVVLADDHVARGFAVLRMVDGLDVRTVRTASMGRGEDGDRQILVLGHDHVEIRTEDGGVVHDVGCREVRAARAVRGVGIQVRITRTGPDGLREPRWSHRVSDPDAEHLEECWLGGSPTGHSGVRLNQAPWREDEYAYRVGRVVTEGARCDVALSGPVLTARQLLGPPGGSAYGESGSRLADALDALGAHSPAIHDVGERYRAWCVERNFVVRGVRNRDAAGHPSDHVLDPGRRMPPQRSVSTLPQPAP